MNIVFIAIVSRLIALKILKSQNFGGPCPLKPHQGSAPGPKLQLQLLRNRFFSYKTQSSFLKRTLVNVLIFPVRDTKLWIHEPE